MLLAYWHLVPVWSTRKIAPRQVREVEQPQGHGGLHGVPAANLVPLDQVQCFGGVIVPAGKNQRDGFEAASYLRTSPAGISGTDGSGPAMFIGVACPGVDFMNAKPSSSVSNVLE